MRTVDVAERRARLARAHRLVPGLRAADVVSAAASIVCLHATEAASVYLSARARTDGMTVGDLERELYVDRTLVKHLAMRRTLWVFPTADLDAAQGGVSDRVAATERRSLTRLVEGAGLSDDGERWLDTASAEVLEALGDGREATSSELRSEIPLLQGEVAYGAGKTWGGRLPVAPLVVNQLAAAGRLVRAGNNGRWAVSRPRWTTMRSWIGRDLEPVEEAEAFADLVGRWLRAFGPGTERDLKWWFGSTLGRVRTALADVGAVEVDLEGQIGYLLPDDLDPVAPVEPWAALLPSMDPATMGWFHRDWYVGPHREWVFDTNGNAGPTAWWQGRVVGGWHQGDAGEVVLDPLEDLDPLATRMLEEEAGRLTDWLGGVTVPNWFPTPLLRARKAVARGGPANA